MNQCACGCGRETAKIWAPGHNRKKVGDQLNPTLVEQLAPEPKPEPVPVQPNVEGGPPPHPAPIDRRRWRLASEKPGTSLTNPWIATKCHRCLLPMWTHDQQTTWEQGGLCEECAYTLITERGVHQWHHFQVQQHRLVDPFRPR
jgi:hypothetical protein